MNSPRNKKLNEWRLLLEERKQKGLPIKEFCQEKNITPPQYYYYQGLINSPEKLKKIKTPKNKPSPIKPIQLINSPSKENAGIRFILPNNLQCILPRDMALNEIKAILEMVMSC
jgi:hypothetical protein